MNCKYQCQGLNKDELSLILGTFLERSPQAVQISEIHPERSGEGFGLNTSISRVHIKYATQHPFPVPEIVLVKEYIYPELVGITSSRASSTAFFRELRFYAYSNNRLFVPRNGDRLFPICYNAGLESETNPEEVANALNALKNRRVLVLEALGDNLDTIIYGLKEQRDNLRNHAENLEIEGAIDGVRELRDKATSLDREINELISNGLATTRHFHDVLHRNFIEDMLHQYELGADTFTRKVVEYNRILMHPRRFKKGRRIKLKNLYKPISNLLCGKDERSRGLSSIIHGDLHHLNQVRDERGQIRLVDAGNITVKGATLALDIAPQLFNPPIIEFSPQDAMEITRRAYMQSGEGSKIGAREIDLFLAIMLAGHNWCFKSAAAHVIAQKKNNVQYLSFLSGHPNHRNAKNKYLKLGNKLLEFVINERKYFMLDDNLADCIQRIRDFELELHEDLIRTG